MHLKCITEGNVDLYPLFDNHLITSEKFKLQSKEQIKFGTNKISNDLEMNISP